ncbi:MAG: hypothetical protein ACI9RU_002133, partial [Litorivivens sp.]
MVTVFEKEVRCLCERGLSTFFAVELFIHRAQNRGFWILGRECLEYVVTSFTKNPRRLNSNKHNCYSIERDSNDEV